MEKFGGNHSEWKNLHFTKRVKIKKRQTFSNQQVVFSYTMGFILLF